MLFTTWKARALEEYRAWTGPPLSPIDSDVVETLRMLHKQGLSPREARMVVCTGEEHGPVEAIRRMGAILSGEQYTPLAPKTL